MTDVLIDTNVLIYALDSSSEFHKQAVEQLRNEENNLFVTTKNISDFFDVTEVNLIEIKK